MLVHIDDDKQIASFPCTSWVISLGAQLELVRVRDLDPLEPADVALRVRDHVARLARLPADAARVELERADARLEVRRPAAEDDAAELLGVGRGGGTGVRHRCLLAPICAAICGFFRGEQCLL